MHAADFHRKKIWIEKKELFEQHSLLKSLKELIQSFQYLKSTKRTAAALIDWVAEADKSNIEEIKAFVHYLRTDWEPVKNAFTYPWSNGHVEVQVLRLKVIKRQMYGWASFDLLCRKVLY
ncbi:transposase [Bacillus xiapuensis]|uniref:transposase n=1 Tax=Bacillus xiapuensis TaxID=2014075 RepID=UPI000C23A5F1|nr:transposase [Bacillus xiapuensis]